MRTRACTTECDACGDSPYTPRPFPSAYSMRSPVLFRCSGAFGVLVDGSVAALSSLIIRTKPGKPAAEKRSVAVPRDQFAEEEKNSETPWDARKTRRES